MFLGLVFIAEMEQAFAQCNFCCTGICGEMAPEDRPVFGKRNDTTKEKALKSSDSGLLGAGHPMHAVTAASFRT